MKRDEASLYQSVMAYDNVAEPPAPDALAQTQERTSVRRSLLRGLARGGKALLGWLVDQILPGSNISGFIVVFAVFGGWWGFEADFVKHHGVGWLNIAGGVLCIGIDRGLRRIVRRVWPERAPTGPQVVYLPLWVWGIAWCVSGTIRLLLSV